MSTHPDINIHFVTYFPDADWDWDELSAHKNTTLDIVKEFPGYPWNRRILTRNPRICNKDILNNPQLPFLLSALPVSLRLLSFCKRIRV
jgi:hypothetical protein